MSAKAAVILNTEFVATGRDAAAERLYPLIYGNNRHVRIAAKWPARL